MAMCVDGYVDGARQVQENQHLPVLSPKTVPLVSEGGEQRLKFMECVFT